MASFPLANVALYAVAAVGIAAVGVIGWRATTSAPLAPKLQPPAVSDPAASLAAPVPAPAGAQSAAVAPPAQSVTAAPTAAAPTRLPAPEFDVVRVEPSGEAVVAGRAPAQSQVALFGGDRKLGEARADANGQFVIIPSTISPGDHLLSLRASGPNGSVASEQTVTVSVTSKPGEKNVAALTAPDRPTVMLSEPRPPPAPEGPAPAVAIRTVEGGEEGAFFASGVAPSGAHVRLYLNNAFVANVQAAPDGKWGLKVERGMAPGHYDVRADMVDATSSAVLARAEVPFDYPAPQIAVRPSLPRPTAAAVPQPPPRPAPPPVSMPASAPALATTPTVQTTSPPQPARPAVVAAPAPSSPVAVSAPAVATTPPVQTGATPPTARPAATPYTATAVATAPAVQTTTPLQMTTHPSAPVAAQSGVAIVPEIQAVTVVRGDNLWRISRKVLGKGARYTQIYDANASQIRDPNRIWPGQIFVAPRSQVN